MPYFPAKTSVGSFHPEWLNQDGKPLACEEKEKTLNENIQEIFIACQDALEDALLMGCDEQCVRKIFHHMIDSLERPF